MANDITDKTSQRVLFAILIGVAVLIAIASVNLYEARRQRAELNDRLAQLVTAVNSRPAHPAAPARLSGPDPDKVYTVNTEGAPFEGPKSAVITIVEFSDFQCPFCAKVDPTLKQLQDVYKDNVQIVWKHYPLIRFHQNAMEAAVAAEAAHSQGKFWQFHDKLLASHSMLSRDQIRQYAEELGLNTAKFESDLTSPEIRKHVTDDMSEAQHLGVTGTPAFFINGHFLSGAQPLAGFAKVINSELQRLKLPIPPAAVPPAAVQ
jgi:protein-disulfide isomerase